MLSPITRVLAVVALAMYAVMSLVCVQLAGEAMRAPPDPQPALRAVATTPGLRATPLAPPWRPALPAELPARPPDEYAGALPRYLFFETFSGLTNQRMAIITGMAMGWLFNATVVLPELFFHLNPRDGREYRPDPSLRGSFAEMFQPEPLRAAMAALGIEVVDCLPEDLADVEKGHKIPYDFNDAKREMDFGLGEIWLRYREFVAGKRVIRVPINWRMWSPSEPADWSLFHFLNDALHFSTRITDAADQLEALLRRDASVFAGQYATLHMRREGFYVRRAHGREGVSWQDAYAYLDEVSCLPAGAPIYIYGGEVDPEDVARFAPRFRVWTAQMTNMTLPSQMQAAVDFLVVQRAYLALSNNAISTFDWLSRVMRSKSPALSGVGRTCQFHLSDPDDPSLDDKAVKALGVVAEYCGSSEDLAAEGVCIYPLPPLHPRLQRQRHGALVLDWDHPTQSAVGFRVYIDGVLADTVTAPPWAVPARGGALTVTIVDARGRESMASDVVYV